ncbi:DNA methyltransferase [Natronobacterium texcoconense]|uniref:Type II methyltransferase n=1 Tax=Natronobacterium texcoconense TaxID=1095778 RepID=A0A1H1HRN1_NATTX|nr:DNA methyltransferase [Natronobacterium texcoconense]SDR28063.1 DNA methylase [Natronobacterium texcoconense]
METYLSLEFTHREALPPGTDEFRTPDALVEHFLETHTEPGDRVLDVFAGYGTTLTAAQRLDRVPYGLEYEPDRVAYIRDRVPDPEHVRQGDVLELEPSWFPTVDCCFTSPPFMEQTDDRNPFRNYAGESSYDTYLEDVETAFSRLESVLAPGAHVVVDVANMKHEGCVTTLAWDVAERISSVLEFEGEVVVTWDDGDQSDGRNGQFGYGYDHSYCLVFTNPGG